MVKKNISILSTFALITAGANGFSAPSFGILNNANDSRQGTSLEATVSRRDIFRGVTSVALGSLATVSSQQPAQATYSAYTNREKDWEERKKSGDIQFSSARSLKSQLREIAPMNAEGSKVFCPNGPSSAVSPLMENKCGDQLAMPSVYGRTEDITGNSIPGFKGGRYPSSMPGDSSALSANPTIGGFPKYQ